jgi:hypothetical protein
MKNLILTILIAITLLSSCKSVKKDIQVSVHKENKDIERTLNNSIVVNKEFNILTQTIEEPIFIDSVGVKVKAVRVVKYESKKINVDSVANTKEKVIDNSEIVTKDKNKKVKKQDYSGIIILIVLLTVAILFFRRFIKLI